MPSMNEFRADVKHRHIAKNGRDPWTGGSAGLRFRDVMVYFSMIYSARWHQ